MLTSIDMMPRIEPALAQRLEALTGEEAAACCEDLTAEADAVRGSRAFEDALLRAQAMSDEGRLTTLGLLKRRGELCGCEVQAALGVSHATVSHHMACLLKAGLVTVERRGKWAYYALAPGVEKVIP